MRNPYLFYCCGRTEVKSLFCTNGDLQQFGNSLVGMKSVSVRVDYGTVGAGGTAVSRGLSPRPLAILKTSSIAMELSLQIVQICESETAQQLALGLPLDKNGKETKQDQITREFASTLAIAERINKLSSDDDVAMCVKKWEERHALKQADSWMPTTSSEKSASTPVVKP